MKRLRVLFMALVSLGLFAGSSLAGGAGRVTLIKVFSHPGSAMTVWSADQSVLLAKSRWDQKSPPALPVERAVAIAQKKAGGKALRYIELRRPMNEIEDVFFYFVALEDADVVILLDGTIVEYDAGKRPE